MARRDPYAWGEERPNARMHRLQGLAEKTELEIQAARAVYEKSVAGIRARQSSLLEECDRIERCLNARGEYDPVLAKAVAPGGWNSLEVPAKRPPWTAEDAFPRGSATPAQVARKGWRAQWPPFVGAGTSEQPGACANDRAGTDHTNEGSAPSGSRGVFAEERRLACKR